MNTFRLAPIYRVHCSSGFILGSPAPLPPIKHYDQTYAGLTSRQMRGGGYRNKTPEQLENYRLGAQRGWERRRAKNAP